MQQSQPRSLLSWFDALYARTAIPEEMLSGGGADLGVWPMAMQPFLDLLLACYTPTGLDGAADITYDAHAEIVLPGLGLTTPTTPGTTPAAKPKPTCWLFFTGGKDSLAEGVLAARAGYAVRALFVRKVNRSYPHEERYAQECAERLGWPFTALTPQLPPMRVGERPRGISVIRNPYMLVTALTQLCGGEHSEPLPAAYAYGGYAVDDCDDAEFFSEFEVSYRAMDALLRGLYAEAAGAGIAFPTRLEPLRDPRQAYGVWLTLPAEVRALTTSCMMPWRNKALHRRQVLAQGVPLLEYECGHCYKCCEKAVLLAQLGADPGYPPDYLAYAAKRVAKMLKAPVEVTPSNALRSPWLAEIGYDGTSLDYLWDVTFDGQLPGKRPMARETISAIATVEPEPEPMREPAQTTARPARSRKQQPDPYRIRVRELRHVRASELVPAPFNPRRHPAAQANALRHSLETIGVAGAVLTRVLPDGRLELIDGALRRDELGDQVVPCLVTDLSAEEAEQALAEHDAITLLAEYDTERSADLAERLADYASESARLLRAVADANPATALLAHLADSWTSDGDASDRDNTDTSWMEPDDEDEDDELGDEDSACGPRELRAPRDGELGSGYYVFVACASEAEQQRAWQLLTDNGFSCRLPSL